MQHVDSYILLNYTVWRIERAILEYLPISLNFISSYSKNRYGGYMNFATAEFSSPFPNIWLEVHILVRSQCYKHYPKKISSNIDPYTANYMFFIHLNFINVPATCHFCYFSQIQTLRKTKLSKTTMFFNPKSFTASLMFSLEHLNCSFVEKSSIQKL